MPVLPVMLSLAGCTPARHITVRDTSSDTLRITVVKADTLRIADSTVIDRTSDTVRIDRWHTVERRTVLRDTVWRSRTDTVSVAVPVPARTTLHDSVPTWLAGAAAGAMAVMAIALWRLIRR